MPLLPKRIVLTLPCSLFLIFLLFTIVTQSPAATSQYQLAISFDIAQKQLTGTAKIILQPNEPLTLHTGELEITGILLKRQQSINELQIADNKLISIPAQPYIQELFVSYERYTAKDDNNLISEKGITLIDSWHPLPERKMQFHLTAVLPKGFTAITESDTFPLKRKKQTVFSTFSQPVHSIHFVAGPFQRDKITVRDSLTVYTLFFPEDKSLASGYLKKAKQYINSFEEKIGPFPYNHFVITANRNPTGLGIPTFTLLGQAVLRLPFIVDTSLGHEIVHSWFGNSVGIAENSGNWCEGLTSYLADHAFRQRKNEGPHYRKEAILNYLSYVGNTTPLPLNLFINASHSQHGAKSIRAVGYSKGMMLFHELQETVGDLNFNMGIRKLYSQHQGTDISWAEISNIFSSVSGQKLKTFFDQRLTRSDIPSFYAMDISQYTDTKSSGVEFTVVQTNKEPYDLKIPIQLNTAEGVERKSLSLIKSRQKFRIPSKGKVLSLSFDPEYSLMRELSEKEIPPTWSQFLGVGKKLIVVESESALKEYQPLITLLRKDDAQIRIDSEVTNGELQDSDILFLGSKSKSYKSLFGATLHQKDGFTLDVKKNPLSSNHVAVIITSSNSSETKAVVRKLPHYGKYSFLHFKKGRMKEQRVAESQSGLLYQLEQLPTGGSTGQISSFESLTAELAKNDVIYIGETHTSMSDHKLQLRLIESISSSNEDIAIGMEMFPKSSQTALDHYFLQHSDMTEKEFLKASRYFEVWRYDFRYFREILQFAKKRTIPVIGLNIERDIVSKVFKAGNTDTLTEVEKTDIAEERDLNLPGYRNRLQSMYSVHAMGNHGNGMASGFIQAQAIWDETMAESITEYLERHPGRKMIVLAGSQHTRKDSGIPPRVSRRIGVKQASVINIVNGSSPANLTEIADYFFLSEHYELLPAPKIGIVLQEDVQQNQVRITEFSPHTSAEKAGLRINDIIIEINGIEIESMEDVRISMFDAEANNDIEVTVKRGKKDNQKIFNYSIRPAKMPTAMVGHP